MTSQLLINEPPLQVLPTLAQAVGLNEAIVLQQVHYWLNPQFNKNFFDGKHWVHNTFTQWHEQFAFWSKKTIKRTIASLEDSGLLVSFVTGGFKKTKYYTLNYDLLVRISRPDTPAADTSSPKEQAKDSCSTMMENPPSPSGGQSDPFEEVKKTLSRGTTWPFREGQPDPLDRVNMAPSPFTESTPEITSENTPPLPRPSWVAAGAKNEEEEDEKELFSSDGPLSPVQLYERMVQIWNQTVQAKLHLGNAVHVTPKRQQTLETLLQTVLKGNLDSWQNYCALIAESRFLMGHNPSGFKVTLDWALVPDNACKVLEGAIYDKPELSKTHPNSLSWEEFEADLAKTLPSSPYLLPWLKISVCLAKIMGQEKYRNRFGKVSVKELTQSKILFSAENSVIKDSLVRHYSAELRCAVESVYPSVKHIDFVVCPSETTPTSSPTTGVSK